MTSNDCRNYGGFQCQTTTEDVEAEELLQAICDFF